jgi:acetamidase/formamidase
MRSDVTLRCDVVKGRSPAMTWPRIETPDAIVTVAVGRPLEEALWAALRDMILWVRERTGLTTQEAYALVGVAGHARPGQAQVGLYSMRCILPRVHLPTASGDVVR